MSLIFIILLINFEILAYIFGKNAKVEELYYSEMIENKNPNDMSLCQLSPDQQIAVCEQLFIMWRYKAIWKSFLNKTAFYELQPKCIQQKISFLTLNILISWNPFLLTCHGQRIPIRTRWDQDDLFEVLYLSAGPTWNTLYLYQGGYEDREYHIRVFDKINSSIDIRQIPERKIVPIEKDREKYLNTVVTTNYNILEIEKIFIHEIIQNRDFYPDWFQRMPATKLLTVCLSIFTNYSFVHEGYVIDRNDMLTRPYERRKSLVFFQQRINYNGFELFTYPCRGKHENGVFADSVKMIEVVHLAAGRRHNSIFAFKKFGSSNSVKLIFYVENFDFDNLRPSDVNETESYLFLDDMVIDDIPPDFFTSLLFD